MAGPQSMEAFRSIFCVGGKERKTLPGIVPIVRQMEGYRAFRRIIATKHLFGTVCCTIFKLRITGKSNLQNTADQNISS